MIKQRTNLPAVLKPKGLRSDQEKKLARIRAIRLKEVPVIPQIK